MQLPSRAGIVARTLLVASLPLVALSACSSRSHEVDADAGAGFDAGPPEDGGEPSVCECTVGSHNELIYLMSDEGELWSYDPPTGEFAFVVGPVCGGMSPFSMAVDARGIAHVVFIDSLSILTFDVNDPGPCEDSGYVRRDMRFGLFGMSFAAESSTDFCSDLYVMTYDGDGPFEEGPDLGHLGVIDAETMTLSSIGTVDFDGGELTGTGDGRLFAFAGADPVKLVEYDKDTAEELERIPLTGVRKTNASAVAFHSGDIYVFTEAVPPGCRTCLADTCGAAYDACRADEVCNEHLECAITEADIRDDCGGFLSAEMMTCLSDCGDSCFVLPRNRVSEVIRYDLDASEGEGRGFTVIEEQAPIRVVGAATSPCVQTIPF